MLVFVVSVVAYAVFKLADLRFFPAGPAFLPTTAVALGVAAYLQSWLQRRFQFFPQATTACWEAYAVANRETRIEGLEQGFVRILEGWGQADHALILADNNGVLRGANVELAEKLDAIRALRQLRWISPERLAREKSTPEREILGASWPSTSWASW